MNTEPLPNVRFPDLREFIARTMGLDFPPQRWPDLQRGLAGAASELGFTDATACAEWLSSARLTNPQLEVLANHLTVGETYFFREKKTFEALAERVLPELVFSRRNREPRLRIWSAACSTGEEAYSLAILLHQVIPDLADWNAMILATDINRRFLQKAESGVYGEWSFRGTSEGFKERYFTRAEDGLYSILPKFRKRVTFVRLNLVEDGFPPLIADTSAIDVIFCRNVLMYFTPAQARRVVNKLHRALANGGWLVLSPSECSQAASSGLTQVSFPGAIFYQKNKTTQREASSTMQVPETAALVEPVIEAPKSQAAVLSTVSLEPASAASAEEADRPEAPRTDCALAAALLDSGHYSEAAEMLLASPDPIGELGSKAVSLLARALANQGKLTEALEWCDRWVASAKMDFASHYLRAIVLQELGDSVRAQRSLQRAIYINPEFVLAHFALGNIARSHGKIQEAERHFANVSHLLRRFQPDELLPESDGLTASRLTEIVNSIIETEAAR